FPPRGPRAEPSPTGDWAAAARAVLGDPTSDEAARLLARHLDAPMLRRSLTEAHLPARLDRLVLVATAQTPAHPLDSAPLVPLVLAWLDATAADRTRTLTRRPDIVTVTARPDIVADVHDQLRDDLVPLLGEARTAVVHAGGTPAMALAATLAAAATGHPVRIVQVLRGGRVTEADLGPLPPTPLHPL
ncbi:MAG: hypothetical protein D6683_16645, partial [Actinomyces sp.]